MFFQTEDGEVSESLSWYWAVLKKKIRVIKKSSSVMIYMYLREALGNAVIPTEILILPHDSIAPDI